MNFIHFGLRMEIERQYLDWCEREGIANKPNSLVVFMMEKGWLDEEKIIKDLKELKDESQICDTCKYGKDKHRYVHICNECGVGINNYEPKDEPQTAECPFDDAIPCEWVNCPNSPNCPYKPKDEPQYDFGEYADRLWKIAYERGKREALEQTEPTISKMEQVEQRSCDTCKNNDIEGWKNPCLGCTEFTFYEPKDELQKHCHRPNNVACHPEQDDMWCRGCDYWYANEPQTERSE